MANFRNNPYIRRGLFWLRQFREMHISAHAAHACFFLLLSVFPMLVLMLGR